VSQEKGHIFDYSWTDTSLTGDFNYLAFFLSIGQSEKLCNLFKKKELEKIENYRNRLMKIKKKKKPLCKMIKKKGGFPGRL